VKTVLSTKGQVVIPDDIRRRKALQPGDELELEEIADGVILRKRKRNRGLVRLLLNCPVKGFEIPKMEGELHPPEF
jgi:AbrB family looped-hinge helix DNA binding protein